jgi:biopolymer transport protein ExbD
MAFGSFDSSGASSRPLAEINMVPLIDVMLVLLVIFSITAPLLTHSVKLDLPKASSTNNLTKPDNIQLAINAAGTLYWNGAVVDRTALRQRLEAAAKVEPQPEVHLHADKTTQYQALAELLADTAKVGLTRIGLISDPHEAQ